MLCADPGYCFIGERKAVNKTINELVKTGLSKRQEDILGLEQIANAIKADLQLQRDELRRPIKPYCQSASIRSAFTP